MCEHTNVAWTLDEEVNEKALSIVRLAKPVGKEDVWAHPQSVQAWAQNFLDNQEKRIAKSKEESLIKCGSLDRNKVEKEKFATLFGVMNLKPAIVWPEGFESLEVSQYYVRTYEALTFSAEGETWPYNGLEGWLVCVKGEAVITVLSQQWSKLAGSDIGQFLAKMEGSMQTLEDKKKIARNVSVVPVKAGDSVWVPFGHVHCVTALPEDRDSKKQRAPGQMLKQKTGPGKKNKNAVEHSQFVWMTCMSKRHHEVEAGVEAETVSKVFGRLIA